MLPTPDTNDAEIDKQPDYADEDTPYDEDSVQAAISHPLELRNSQTSGSVKRIPSHIDGMLDPTPPWDEISLFREILFILNICVAQLFTQASVAQTIVPYKYISASFDVDSPGIISWYSASFSLTVGTFILIAGRLGDMYGLKRMYIIGFSWYAFWSLLCGISVYSRSSIFFSICRAFQGMGPAITMPNAVGILGSYYPPGKKRMIAMCCFASVAPSGFNVGAAFSAIFAQLAWWPWLFYAMSIACTVTAILSYFIIPRNIGNDFSGKRQTFDTWGALSGVSGLFLFNFAWNQGAVVGWQDPYVYVLFIVGLIIIGAFLYIEIHIAESPLVPKAIFKKETGIILGCVSAGWASFGVWVYYTFQFGIGIEGRTPLDMAARMAPTSIMGILSAIITAILLPRVPLSFIMVLSMTGFLAGALIMGFRPVNQIYWAQMFVSFIITPIGMDTSFPSATIVLSQMLPKEQQGVAGSIVNTVVNYSISIGLGVAGAVDHYQSKAGKPRLRVIRDCFYTGMGIAGLGLLLSMLFVYKQVISPKIHASSSTTPLRETKEPVTEA